MNISKDESRILRACIEDYKYEIVNSSHVRGLPLMDKLTELEKRLEDFGKDKRRNGRTSQNDWFDLLLRFSSK